MTWKLKEENKRKISPLIEKQNSFIQVLCLALLNNKQIWQIEQKLVNNPKRLLPVGLS